MTRRPPLPAVALLGVVAVLVAVAAAAVVVPGRTGADGGGGAAGWQATYRHVDAEGRRSVVVQRGPGTTRVQVGDASGTAVVLRHDDGTGWTCGRPVGSSTRCWEAGQVGEPPPPVLVARAVVSPGTDLDDEGCAEDGRWCYDADGRLVSGDDRAGARLTRTTSGPLAEVDTARPR